MHQLEHFDNKIIRIDRLEQHLASLEQQTQALDDIARSPVVVGNVFENGAHFTEIRLGTTEVKLRRLRVAEDGGERLIQFVGDGT